MKKGSVGIKTSMEPQDTSWKALRTFKLTWKKTESIGKCQMSLGNYTTSDQKEEENVSCLELKTHLTQIQSRDTKNQLIV